MTTQSSSYPRAEFLINTFTDWLKHRRELNEMRLMNRGDFDRIAADLGISPGDLDELVRRRHRSGIFLELLRQRADDQAA
jgi:uncharacterized protein YjiS (DUF1127 family)